MSLALQGNAPFRQSQRFGRSLQNTGALAELPETCELPTDLEFRSPYKHSSLLQVSDGHPTAASYGSLLQNAQTLLELQIAHHQILTHGFEHTKLVEGLLIRNYTRLCAIKDSLSLFLESHEHSLDLWNSFIMAYACQGRHSEAVFMFLQMQQEGIVPDRITFMQIVSSCARHADLNRGRWVHACVRATIYDMDISLGTSLISMYDKCNNLKDACRKWHEIPVQNEVSWTAIIACHVHQNQLKEAFQLFVQMQKQGVKPNKVTIVCILDVFASPSALAGGRVMHTFIAESGFDSDTKFDAPLISMYKHCGSTEDANVVFEITTNRNILSWNAMISTCAQDLNLEKALQLFVQLGIEGFMPDHVTFISIISVCASSDGTNEGRWIHARALEGGFASEVKVGTALINMYGRFGMMTDIDSVFSKLRKRDVVLWTSMIAIYSQHEQRERAFKNFFRMQQDGVGPSSATFVCILDTFNNSMDLVQARGVHGFIVEEGHESNPIVSNALLSMYGRFGYLDDARDIFVKMRRRTVVSWTALIAVNAQHGQSMESVELWTKMHLDNVRPNLVTLVTILDVCALEESILSGRHVHASAVEYGYESDDALVSALACMYSKLGDTEDSEAILDCLPHKSEFLSNVKISLHAQQGFYESSVRLLAQMWRSHGKPSVAAYVSVLDAFASRAVLEDGELVHSSAIDIGCDADTNVATALLNMYGRCGSLEGAWTVFNSMAEQNVIASSAMIALNGQHGCGEDALLLFERMQCRGCTPNKVTFSNVLDACNHSGLLSEALGCFFTIVRNHAPLLDLDHYASIVDVLGRTGCLDASDFLLMYMPQKPTALLLTSMLCACRYHADVERATRIVNFAMELDSDDMTTYVLLSNLSACSSHMENFEESMSVGCIEEQM